jgi:hypothetical protein
MRDEREVGEDGPGRDDLRTGNDKPRVGFFLDVHTDIRDFVRRTIAIDRRMNDGVIDERDAFLAEAVPAPRVLLIRRVEVGVCPERREKRCLVVGRPADPAVGQPRPFGDR